MTGVVARGVGTVGVWGAVVVVEVVVIDICEDYST
jgi:hypothetical protein